MTEQPTAHKSLWDKIDAHGQRISNLEANEKLADFRLKSQERRMDQLLEHSAQQHGALQSELKEYNKQVSTIIKEQHKRIGADNFVQYATPAAISFLGLLLALAVYLKP